MAHKHPLKIRTSTPRVNDEHALLKQEDFVWLAEINKVLSPYWSARSSYESSHKLQTIKN